MPLLQNTFVHHVHFWLRNKADKDKLIEGLNLLLPIEHIRSIHIGVPAKTFRDVVDRSYDVSLLLLFETPEAQEAYQVDATHHIFANDYAKPICSKGLYNILHELKAVVKTDRYKPHVVLAY